MSVTDLRFKRLAVPVSAWVLTLIANRWQPGWLIGCLVGCLLAWTLLAVLTQPVLLKRFPRLAEWLPVANPAGQSSYPSWLEEMVQEERAHPTSSIRTILVKALFSHNMAPPFVTFHVRLFNAGLLRLQITGVHGHLVVNAAPIRKEDVSLEHEASPASHNGETWAYVVHTLNQEAADYIRDAHSKGEVNIQFAHLKLRAERTLPDGRSVSFDFPFATDLTFRSANQWVACAGT